MNPQVNVAGMNATGAPASGAQGMTNPGANRTDIQVHSQVLLNTYIYDYFLKNSHWDVARAIRNNSNLQLHTKTNSSPNNRGINGVDDTMDSDSKDDLNKRPDDLPEPAVGVDTVENSFLMDWWGLFMDIMAAHRGKAGSGSRSAQASQYLMHTRVNQQFRNEQQQRMMLSGGMAYNPAMLGRMANGMPLPKQAMQNNRSATNPAQLQALQQAKMLQMQRDGSSMDMSQRPQSPNSAENAPSPSKRPRIDGNNFNGQGIGPGRSQAMQGPQGAVTSGAQANQMVMANGMNPADLPPNQFAAFQSQNPGVQGKALEGVPQGSPMAQANMDGSTDMFAGNANARGQPQSSHALQDYQMQLMLLEQQNKKRLLMARQEQDNMTQAPHTAGAVGQPGFPPAMSPQGSRAGPSPNPNEQVKRGTPKMGQTGLPGSPMPDAAMQQNRGSPIPNSFDPTQMPPGMPPQYYNPGMGANNMRPPSSHPNAAFNGGQMSHQQMEALRRNNQQLPNGVWQPNAPQMMQQNQGQQSTQMGTPQQRNAMPPPPAPQSGGENQRTQPSSPAQQSNAAPPTPSQAAKPNPKGKKEKQEPRKKASKKNAAAASATPASEAPAEPPTPTPSTPITPMHASSSFSQKGVQGGANAQPPAQGPNAAAQIPTPQVDPNGNAPFAGMDSSDNTTFNLDFGAIDGENVLENLDFDSFLQTEDNGGFGGLDGVFSFNDGVEAGTGDI